jgi:shikimate kinase
MKGSQNNDPFFIKEGKIAAETNNSGGILGGISIGSPILMKVAFKPPSSVGIMQKSVDMAKMEEVSIYIKGRHDPCVALRAVPVVEAAAAIALYDMIKKAKGNIYLIGMPGSGKTTVGKALSHMTGLLFFDTDSLVVDKAGMSIPEIFSKYSEEYFRGLEKEIISRVSGFTQCIIATGGGSVLDNDNRKKIKNSGVCVYIMRDIQKLASEGRPLSSSKEEISKLYKNRNPIYELMSDIVADNNFTAEHCAKNIAEELELVTINE